jgi:hypothetical protein
VKLAFAVALAVVEHALGLPLVSRARTETTVAAAVLRPVSRTVIGGSDGCGLDVGDGTTTEVPFGHGDAEVP